MFAIPILSAVTLLFSSGSMLNDTIAAMLLGLALGAEVDVMGYLLSRYLGTRYFTTFFAGLMALANVAAGLGSYAAGVMYDVTGDYDLLLVLLIPGFVISAAVMATLGRYPVLSAGSPSAVS